MLKLSGEYENDLFDSNFYTEQELDLQASTCTPNKILFNKQKKTTSETNVYLQEDSAGEHQITSPPKNAFSINLGKGIYE